MVHLEDGLEHLPIVEELVVLWSVFDRSGVLDEAGEQIVVLAE